MQVDLFGWFNEKTFMDGVILGQVTPGSIIIAATFFGYMHFGILGSLLATVCVFTPSFLILMGIIPFFDRLKSYPQFNKVKWDTLLICRFVGSCNVSVYHWYSLEHSQYINHSVCFSFTDAKSRCYLDSLRWNFSINYNLKISCFEDTFEKCNSL